MMKSFLLAMSDFGIWDILSLALFIGGALYGYFRFFRPTTHIPNLTVFFNYQRLSDFHFPLQLTVEFTNHTGKSAFITSVWFKCVDIRPHPNARLDAGTKRLEIKFPESRTNEHGERFYVLSAFECYLKDGSSAPTFVPLDPSHTDDEIRRVLQDGLLGYLECYVTLLSREHKPTVYRLRVCPRKDYNLTPRPLWKQLRLRR